MPILIPFVLGMSDQRAPDFEKARPVGFDRKRRIAADERVDHADAQRRRGVDHRAEVRHVNMRLGPIRRQWVGIISQSRDGHLVGAPADSRTLSIAAADRSVASM